MKQRLQKINWESVANNMHEKGFSVITNLLTDEECNELVQNYTQPNTYRKTVMMERYRFGLGEYKYFDYPLPNIIHQIRTEMYPHLAPIANLWFKALKMDTKFPLNHAEFLEECHKNGQQKATVLILKYGKGGYNTLHQDLYGEIYFPIQTVLFLNEPDKDYTGGEFVLTQQIPRAQSKAIVLKPKKGDLLVFTTNFKPEKGKKGYYRVNMKHGVSEVHSGKRYTLGIIFHDATN
ncbi:2OG-Fe(II) oxygenase [Flavobacterium dauae]|nr:2OG-Fe(II) oxygenase [Flavobacterium dauae]NGM67386.1 2OG-Fe(II) oxygenase [Sphingobacterium sp. SGR-19]WLD25207.1 2OG-Fe(II) oxygenase [Flavobacterium dauae]